MLWKRKTPKKQRSISRPAIDFSVDHLEERRLLAGSVTTSLAGGSLVISGDGQDNVIAAFQVNGELALVGVDTEIADADISTSILGLDLDIKLVQGVTKDVTAILRGGDDAFLIGGSVEGLELAEVLGSDDLSFGPASLPRDLKIYTNGGRDLVVVSGTQVGRDLVIDTGFGLEDTVVIGGGGVAMAVLDAIQDFDFDDLPPITASALEGGQGLDVIGEIAGALLSPVEIGRDLRIAGESSDDAIYVGGASIGRDAIINTNIGEDQLYFGTGMVIAIEGFELLNDFAQEGFGLDDFYLSSFVSVGRNASLNTGDGDDVAWIGGQRVFTFNFDGVDPDSQDEGLEEPLVLGFRGGVTVEKNMTLNVSAHDDLAYVGVGPRFNFGFPSDLHEVSGGEGYNVRVGRDLNLLTQADDDYLQIGGSLGSIETEEPGLGMEGALYVGRDMNIDTGAGTDELVIGELEPIVFFARPSLEALPEGEGLVFFMVRVGRDLDIRTGWHDDILLIGGGPNICEHGEGEGLLIGNLLVGRDLDINTDGGNDEVALGYVAFGQNLISFDEGGPDDYAPIQVGRDLDMRTGDQDDNVTIDHTHVGDDAKIRTEWGRDSLVIGEYGDVTIGDQLTIDTSLERDTIAIRYTEVGGHLSIKTGLRDDRVLIEQTYVGGNATIKTERGNDEVAMEYVYVDGDVNIDTQREDDDVYVLEVEANRLRVLGGNEDDNICVFDSKFTQGALLDGGSGIDGISTNVVNATVINAEGPADCEV